MDDMSLKQIEFYLDGTMSQEEEEECRKQLSKQPDLAREVLMQQEAIAALKQRETLKAELRAMYNQAQEKKATPARYIYMGIAASVSLLIAVMLIIKVGSQPDYLALYDEYYVPLEAEGNYRGEPGQSELYDIDKADSLYKSGQYAQAITAYESLHGKTDKPGNVALYLGNSYMQTGQFDKAESVLGEVINAESNFLKQYAQWYLSLVYIRQGKQKEAKDLLTMIRSQKGIYYSKAAELLEEIE